MHGCPIARALSASANHPTHVVKSIVDRAGNGGLMQINGRFPAVHSRQTRDGAAHERLHSAGIRRREGPASTDADAVSEAALQGRRDEASTRSS